MTGGYLQLRRGLFEHVTEGKMTYTECFAYVAIAAHADPESGIWVGSAGLLRSLYGLSARTARDVLEKLASKRYIKRFPIPGSHSNYPILVNKYECSNGAAKGMRLNADRTIDYKAPVYESCEESVERGVKHGAGIKEENRDKRIKAPKKPALEPPTHEFFDEAKRLFEVRLGEPPTWDEADHVQLAKLRKKKPDLTLVTFCQRFQNFLNSPVPFHQQQGGSLKWFCPNWDKFINLQPVNGNSSGGSGPGPFVVRPRGNPAASSARGEDILRNAVKGALSLKPTVRTA